MTKKEARAIIACRDKISAALRICRNALSGQEAEYADAYWMSHIRQSINGDAYGSMPIYRAEETVK